MSRTQALILSDSGRSPLSSQPGDWHDATGHHRYYGSSACNGGERISETRRGPRPAAVNLFGF
jgi:hypothetical protein